MRRRRIYLSVVSELCDVFELGTEFREVEHGHALAAVALQLNALRAGEGCGVSLGGEGEDAIDHSLSSLFSFFVFSIS
jgi:hypothetical protein